MSNQRDGFGLIEVIIAMLLLTVGVLAMGASTGYILNQVRSSELRTERMVAVQGAVDRLQAENFDDLPSRCQAAVVETPRFTVRCAVTMAGTFAHIRLVSVGPGFSNGRLDREIEEAMIMRIARPI